MGTTWIGIGHLKIFYFIWIQVVSYIFFLTGSLITDRRNLKNKIPKSGFRIRVQPIVDDAFRRQFRDVKERKEKVDAIFEDVKGFFLDKSLTTKYKLDIAPLRDYRGDLSNQISGSGLW